MITKEINGKKVELFDNIEELPITRFHAFNKMLLIDAGVGSDLADWDSHLEKAIRFIRTNKPEHAEKELENVRQCVYFVQQNISPKNLAFCALVKSVDGREYNTMTTDGLMQVSKLFQDAPNGEIATFTEEVKKKIDEELQDYFPKLFDDASVKEYYDKMRQRTIVILDEIIEGKDRREEIEKLTDLLMTYTKPQSFSGADGVEVQYDKQFENMCLLLSQRLHVNAKKFTTLEYYNAFEYLKAEIKQASKIK